MQTDNEMTLSYGNYPVADMHRHYVDVLLKGKSIIRILAEERNRPIEGEKEAFVQKLCNSYNEYDTLKEENERLREENNSLKNSFYMDICRAYNGGKENALSMVAESKKTGEQVDTFKSSHEYFINEFPDFKTNVP